MPFSPFIARLHFDPTPIAKEEGNLRLFCKTCLEEAMAAGHSPEEIDESCSTNIRILVSIDAHHMQLWCIRHDRNIAIVSVKSQELRNSMN